MVVSATSALVLRISPHNFFGKPFTNVIQGIAVANLSAPAGTISLGFVLSQNGFGFMKRLSTFFVMRETLFL